MTIATQQLMLSQRRLVLAAPSQQVFTTSTTWTVPAGVYSVSVVCVGKGNDGGTNGGDFYGGSGGTYGGGGGRNSSVAQPGGPGAVRVIWPGDLRQFPSTRTANE